MFGRCLTGDNNIINSLLGFGDWAACAQCGMTTFQIHDAFNCCRLQRVAGTNIFSGASSQASCEEKHKLKRGQQSCVQRSPFLSGIVISNAVWFSEPVMALGETV